MSDTQSLQDVEDDSSEDDSSDSSVENEDTTTTTNASNENQNSSTSSIKAEHLFGPRKTIPDNVLDLLEEWHREHPAVHPECSYRNRKPRNPSKVFDRSGKELLFSIFLVIKPIRYTIIFVHDMHGPGKLVACLSHSNSRSFLLGWNGIEKGYDTEVSVVRLFARSLDDISFSPQVFEKVPAQHRLFRFAVGSQYALPARNSPKTTTGISTTISNTASSNRAKPRPRGSGSSQNFRMAQPQSESEYESESESGTSDSSSSEPDNNNNNKKQKTATRPSKRLKKSNPVSLPQPPPPQSPENPHRVAFKLISEISDATRCFPISECTTGKDLFSKAKKFYHLLDDELDVTVLSCRIPSKHERRYLFRGSEGEFNMLLQDVNRGLQGVGGEKTLIVEVRCMD